MTGPEATATVEDTRLPEQVSLEAYAASLETIPNAVLLVDDQGEIAFANAHLTRLIGCEAPDLISQPLARFHPDSFHLVHREGQLVPIEAAQRRIHVAGQSFTLHVLRDRWSGHTSEPAPRDGVNSSLSDFRGLVVLGRSLSACRTHHEMVACLLTGATAFIGGNGSALAVHDTSGVEVIFEQGTGVLSDWTDRRVLAESSVSAQVIASGVPWITSRAAGDPRLGQRDLPPGIVAYASIPVVGLEGTVCALVVTRHWPFADDEIAALKAIGELAGAFLQRQRTFEQMMGMSSLLNDSCEQVIDAWSRALELKAGIAVGHTQRVTDLTVKLSCRLGISGEQLSHIRRGAMLHDIGMIVVPDGILLKQGPLSDVERALVRKHVDYAYELLGRIEYLRPAMEIPAFHHERWDGSGYARGLAAEQIPLAARIFAVVDVYDALISDRPYSTKQTPASAVQTLLEGRGRLFDPRVVDAFCALTRGA